MQKEFGGRLGKDKGSQVLSQVLSQAQT